jgi:hypothetical protein
MSEAKKANQAYVRRTYRPVWGVLGLMVLSSIIMQIWSALANAPQPPSPPKQHGPSWLSTLVITIAFFAALFIWAFTRSWLAFKRGAQAKDAETAVRIMFPPPSGREGAELALALRATNAAIVFAMYGEPRRAMEVLDAVRWSEQPPAHQAYRASALAIIALIDGRFPEGAALAAGAVPLVAGVREKARAFVTLVNDMGLALTGNPEARARLQLHRHGSALFNALRSALVWWTLSKVYAQDGQSAKAAESRANCAAIFPHAAALLGLPVHVESVAASDRSNPYATPVASVARFDVHRRTGGWAWFFLVAIATAVAIGIALMRR